MKPASRSTCGEAQLSDREDPAAQRPPKVGGVLETALYVDDLARAATFYDELFGFPQLFENHALVAYDVAGQSVLLLFRRGGSAEEQRLPSGSIPGHDASGPIHIAFSIASDEVSAWEKRLAQRDVAIEGRVSWPRGGTSLYFRDPDDHLLELATPGLWATY
jgi:catechol 2,3-dioxygenase-like lactoylglutathione lyase family enzyme